jgi:hypothetical protein
VADDINCPLPEDTICLDTKADARYLLAVCAMVAHSAHCPSLFILLRCNNCDNYTDATPLGGDSMTTSKVGIASSQKMNPGRKLGPVMGGV